MERVRLTLERIADITCPAEKRQFFLWDTEAPGLAVRVTATGAKSFIFESKLNRQTIRITLGDVRAWVLKSVWKDGKEIQRGAREEAGRLKTLIDQGKDPRQVAADEMEAVQAKRHEQAAAKLEAERIDAPALAAWSAYIEARHLKWGELTRRDHERASKEGGEVIKRGRKTSSDGLTQPGALRPLLRLPLVQINAERVQAWLADEVAKRPTHAALAFRLLRAFLNWCADRPEYAGQVQLSACASKTVRGELPKKGTKDDCLQREQLLLWFEHVRKLPNPVHAAYLQSALLTGARREELGGLRWDDVDFQWCSLTIRDKVEGQRVIPLTPYVLALLRDLKARNDTPPPQRLRQKAGESAPNWEPSPWVFSSASAASGRLQEPRIAHNKAIAAAGLPALTIHGLRRSFGTLAEWVECPTGVSAQIMGHKPSAIAEKHYRRRPLDLLRMWHTRIEAWILEQAGIEQPSEEAKLGLRFIAIA